METMATLLINGSWAIAAFFGLYVLAACINFYLRYIDHLPIERSDVKDLGQNLLKGVAFAGVAYLLREMSFFPAIVAALILVSGYLMYRISTQMRHLRAA